jgi:hypothetical protein
MELIPKSYATYFKHPVYCDIHARCYRGKAPLLITPQPVIEYLTYNEAREYECINYMAFWGEGQSSAIL